MSPQILPEFIPVDFFSFIPTSPLFHSTSIPTVLWDFLTCYHISALGPLHMLFLVPLVCWIFLIFQVSNSMSSPCRHVTIDLSIPIPIIMNHRTPLFPARLFQNFIYYLSPSRQTPSSNNSFSDSAFWRQHTPRHLICGRLSINVYWMHE